jgi:hypothetical protein
MMRTNQRKNMFLDGYLYYDKLCKKFQIKQKRVIHYNYITRIDDVDHIDLMAIAKHLFYISLTYHVNFACSVCFVKSGLSTNILAIHIFFFKGRKKDFGKVMGVFLG